MKDPVGPVDEKGEGRRGEGRKGFVWGLGFGFVGKVCCGV